MAHWEWRGAHVAVKQLVENYARYLGLPRLANVFVSHVSGGSPSQIACTNTSGPSRQGFAYRG